MTDRIFEVLSRGEIAIEGRFANSSNLTLLCSVELEGAVVLAVYKPEEGERPLWDFPGGLWRREVAAHVLDAALDLGMVPTTVGREDGPLGPGSLQRFVEVDDEAHYFTLREASEHEAALMRLAAFDVVANNTDRKSGHVLLGPDGLVAIDHGLTFHVEDKLRTVIWDFAGEPIEIDLRAKLASLAEAPPDALRSLLQPPELEALRWRAGALAEAGELPVPDEDAPWPPYPWPLV